MTREENEERKKKLFPSYNPYTGEGSLIDRAEFSITYQGEVLRQFLPVEMIDNEKVISEMNGLDLSDNLTSREEFQALVREISEKRFKYDFEFWAVVCVLIMHKITKKEVPFVLNSPQRKLLAKLEKMRIANKPIRLIIAKARQWGGSTLTQVYMSWIQIIHKRNWHSAICTEIDDQARNIRAMYQRIVDNYPAEFETLTMAPFAGSTKNKVIREKGNIIGVGSAVKPNSLRSFDFAMLHGSEVAYWPSTEKQSAEALVQSLRGGIADEPYTIIVLESTAKGIGTFFHNEWELSIEGKNNYDHLFVAWWEIEIYQKQLETSPEEFFESLTDYEKFLWKLGATLEGIFWYRKKKTGENMNDAQMHEEFPSTVEEAFQTSGKRIFPQHYVANAKQTCKEPKYIGDIKGYSLKGEAALISLEFVSDHNGYLYIWEMPDDTIKVSNRYAIFVDIGGRTKDADWTVIKVFDRYWMMYGGVPEVVATWRGHLDQDLVAWKAAQIGAYYNNALVAVESNSLTKEQSEGDHYLTILNEIAPFYENLFTRNDTEAIKDNVPTKYGFHTNKATKGMIIDVLVAATRDQSYIERDERACNEMAWYELKSDGTMGAIHGKKDDLVIVTAGGLWLCFHYMPAPQEIKQSNTTITMKRKIVSESSF